MFDRVLMAGATACALLAGCGGGADSAALGKQQSGQGIAVGEPNGGVPVVSEFVKEVQGAACAEERNRLFLVDSKYVVWDRAGQCADNAWGLVLMGPTPQAVLCSAGDSIAGPQTTCADESARPLFLAIQKNLDKADLGLGSGHKVEQLRFLPRDGEPLAFRSLIREAFSGVATAREVVIKDQAAWSALWAEHTRNRVPAPALPEVDFSSQMLVGVFSGDRGNGCIETSVLRTVARGSKLVVEYEERDITAVAICMAAVSQPMHVVAVERVDAPVEFVKVESGAQSFLTLDAGNRSGITAPRKLVVRDSAAFQALWAEHAGPDAKAPEVDFASQMVVGVFLGNAPSACHGTQIEGVSRSAERITVRQVNTEPGPGIACAMMVTYPAHLVAIGRSALPVEFAEEIRTTR
ncbi:protease complex subunit PrcB family protein [Massilia sp. DD77]|uniref:protease complex subunit PrcB family protein n=1 Tax=Massilia sp. DD77 TaxID=3109349 RepID=UPI002FFFCBBC